MPDELTFGSLFSGIGGFDLGFERAGFICKWQVEIDDYATRVLEKHWPNVRRERDIRSVGIVNLPRVDCIIGGFPCQDISVAGRREGIDGERSGLFFQAIRVVRELQPRAVALENTEGLLTGGMDRVLGTLAEVGYDAEWHCIPAAAVGAPHIRDRVFIIAIRREDAPDFGIKRFQEPRIEVPREVSSWRGAVTRSDWWASEPAVGRVAYGVPSRVDRIRCLGNAVVPQVAEVVARITRDKISEAIDS